MGWIRNACSHAHSTTIVNSLLHATIMLLNLCAALTTCFMEHHLVWHVLGLFLTIQTHSIWDATCSVCASMLLITHALCSIFSMFCFMFVGAPCVNVALLCGGLNLSVLCGVFVVSLTSSSNINFVLANSVVVDALQPRAFFSFSCGSMHAPWLGQHHFTNAHHQHCGVVVVQTLLQQSCLF